MTEAGPRKATIRGATASVDHPVPATATGGVNLFFDSGPEGASQWEV